MKLKVFSIRDNAVEAYNTPFFMLTAAEAIRAFTNMANDSQSQMYRNPVDFKLYQVGVFETSTGIIEQIEPEHVASADQCKEQENNITDMFPAKEVQKQ